MKKTLLATLFISFSLLMSNCRTFTNYSQDGQGGVYRKGVKTFFLYADMNYIEHCKKEGNKLVCTSLDEKL